MLARQHQMRTSPEKRHEQGLYTIKETAQLLGITKQTVGNWLEKLNISKIRMDTNERRMYIHYSDVLMLACRKQSRP
jgi:excisionase family DNA binding protein